MIGRLRDALSRQLSGPSGPGGRLVAAAMNRGNRGLNDRAIERLALTPASRVLDLGFGGGLTLPVLLARAGHVVGVDPAPDMVRAAAERHAADVAAGRLELHVGRAEALPLADASVDAVLTVNTVYFWPDLPAALHELRRVLAPGGRLVVGIREMAVMQHLSADVFTLRAPGELAAALEEAGLGGVEVDTAPDGATHLLIATG